VCPSAAGSAVAEALAGEDPLGVLVDARLAGGELLRIGDVEVVLALASGGQRLEGRTERRIGVDALLECIDQY
jgi:hypothetical protein